MIANCVTHHYIPNFNKPKIILINTSCRMIWNDFSMFSAWKVSKYGVFLVLIFLYLDRIQENTDQEKLRIWTIFTQCFHCLFTCFMLLLVYLFDTTCCENIVIFQVSSWFGDQVMYVILCIPNDDVALLRVVH